MLVPPAIERERPNRRTLAEDLADIRNVFAGSRTKKPSLRARFERFLDPALHPGIRDAVKQALNGIVQLSTQLRDEFRNLKAQP